MISNFYGEQTTQVECLSHVPRSSLTIHINYYYRRRFYPSIFPCGVVITGINSNEPTLAYGNYEYLKWQLEGSACKFPQYNFQLFHLQTWLPVKLRLLLPSLVSNKVDKGGNYKIFLTPIRLHFFPGFKSSATKFRRRRKHENPFALNVHWASQ